MLSRNVLADCSVYVWLFVCFLQDKYSFCTLWCVKKKSKESERKKEREGEKDTEREREFEWEKKPVYTQNDEMP